MLRIFLNKVILKIEHFSVRHIWSLNPYRKGSQYLLNESSTLLIAPYEKICHIWCFFAEKVDSSQDAVS